MIHHLSRDVVHHISYVERVSTVLSQCICLSARVLLLHHLFLPHRRRRNFIEPPCLELGSYSRGHKITRTIHRLLDIRNIFGGCDIITNPWLDERLQHWAMALEGIILQRESTRNSHWSYFRQQEGYPNRAAHKKEGNEVVTSEYASVRPCSIAMMNLPLGSDDARYSFS